MPRSRRRPRARVARLRACLGVGARRRGDGGAARELLLLLRRRDHRFRLAADVGADARRRKRVGARRTRRRARPGILPPRRRKHGGGHLAEGHAAARARGPRRARGRTRERRAQRRSRSRRARGPARAIGTFFSVFGAPFGAHRRARRGAPPRAPPRASAPRLRLRPAGRHPRARRPRPVAERSRTGRPDRHGPPRQTKRRLQIVAFASVRPRFRLRGRTYAAIGHVEKISTTAVVIQNRAFFRVRLCERQTFKLARATHDVRPDARVGFARRRAFQLEADFFRLVAHALEPRTRLPRHRPRLAQDVPRHDPVLLDTRFESLDHL
mmetsp:Transcript_2049/g.8542  ORF Transcript_2049/g.8542 Transcript_2049/m.8542 type:complete len:325 (+) Transcript_2049:3-977(+)